MRSKAVEPGQLVVVTRTESSADAFMSTSNGVKATHDIVSAMNTHKDITLVCTKPHDFPIVAKSIQQSSIRDRLIVSTCAGLTINDLSQHLPNNIVIRA